jgi:hypothetical protein
MMTSYNPVSKHMIAAVELVIFDSLKLVNGYINKNVQHINQDTKMNARLQPTFTNAAVTLLQVSPPIFSPAQKETPRL